MASKIIPPIRGKAGVSKAVANMYASGIDAGLRQIPGKSTTAHGDSFCREYVRSRLRGDLSTGIAAAAVPGLADLDIHDFARVIAVPPLGRIAA